jgi:hypothetical protein
MAELEPWQRQLLRDAADACNKAWNLIEQARCLDLPPFVTSVVAEDAARLSAISYRLNKEANR